MTRRIDLRTLPVIQPVLDVVVISGAATGRNGTTVVAVRGELDIATTWRLRNCLDELLRAGHSRLRLELGGLAFCDVAGLSVLLHIQRELRAVGGELVLADPPGSLRRILGALQLERTFLVHG